ncbi:L,D-transpeptidase family protein [Peribacillus castrilensis]|uniref:SH3 domain-containing protein n=1 Tax=Peribacillus simplex TaxID=1478 RepID=A0AAN2PD80_9BACI|nr:MULTISPECIES: L,D-transpeptidase family protein [Bacillaceae]MCF7624995.1 L,D-transpeptidase family protein [Peribacillus frigoritolerans]MCP1095608.1 L,D-transpeptidase family protein [Bacillaceae bacterium OS4b]MEA3574115.1 L,D-transpeptidase family protein [Peribacillus frigoritolerans]CEG30376.1 SH3 domain-containing protein [Peribacillus simplex]
MKRLMMAALIAFLIIQTANLAKAESKTSCESTQFKIVMKSEADVKEKASAASKTLNTYKKNKELSAKGRTGNWYKICHANKAAYINMADVKEVFSADEKALLKKFDRRKGVNQVVSATGKSMSDTKVTIQTYEKKQGEWRRALKKMEGVIGKNGFTKSKKEGDGKSPVGIYSFGTAFGSETKPAGMKMSYKKTTKYDYWIDDQTSRDYNKWKTYKGNPSVKWKSFERMNHELYRYGAVINYNTDPIIKGKGSAIFLHIWRGDTKPTAGCTATAERNVLSLLKWMDPVQKPHIVMGTNDSLKSVK